MITQESTLNRPEQSFIESKLLGKFAFFIHFRYGYSEDMGQLWKPLSKIPDKFYKKTFELTQWDSYKWSKIYMEGKKNDKKLIGVNQVLLLSSDDMLANGFKYTTNKIEKAIDKLVEKGYTNIGLGALTSPMTLGGKMLKNRKDISITNGNAFTAVSIYNGILELMKIDESLIEHQSIVGATGSVGSLVAKMLVKNNCGVKLQLVARNLKKLEALKKELIAISPKADIEVSIDLKDIKKSKLVTLLTASTENLMRSEILQKGAFILDGTQPRNTSPELIEERPDLTVVDGGIISIPGIRLQNGGMGLPENNFYACFSETLLLTLEGYKEHFSIGNPTLEQGEYINKLAQKHKKYGFQLAEFTSFGNPISF
ncbi:hypothetical protein [Brumimicrobium mesophilum]|uniref:hypothetical protein n=1 Tax=Brumimicrobium mesophilum TaxID=392717 RepID=UPI000D141CED|nr:hypothetical protein [Brumimicrobium mesophilum]